MNVKMFRIYNSKSALFASVCTPRPRAKTDSGKKQADLDRETTHIRTKYVQHAEECGVVFQKTLNFFIVIYLVSSICAFQDQPST